MDYEKTENLGLNVIPFGAGHWHDAVNENARKLDSAAKGLQEQLENEVHGTWRTYDWSGIQVTDDDTLETVISRIPDGRTIFVGVASREPAIFCPPASGGGICEISKQFESRCWLWFYNYNSPDIWAGNYYEGKFSGWVPLALGKAPELHAVQYSTGLMKHFLSNYFRDQFGTVHVNLACIRQDDTVYFSNRELLTVLPVGFRPAEIMEMPGTGNAQVDGGKFPCTFYICANGEILLLTGGCTSITSVYLSVSFQAAQ